MICGYLAAAAAALHSCTCMLKVACGIIDCVGPNSAVSGCLFRVRAGLKPAIGGLVLGTLLRSDHMYCAHCIDDGSCGLFV